MYSKPWLPVVAGLAFALAACPPPEEPAEQPPPAEELAPAEEPMAPVQEQVRIMNGTDETLTVTATISDQTQTLGTVRANEQATFTVSAPPGTEIEIEARDPTGEVVDSLTLQVERQPRPEGHGWRIHRNDDNDYNS